MLFGHNLTDLYIRSPQLGIENMPYLRDLQSMTD